MFGIMKRLSFTLLVATLIAAPAAAQVNQKPECDDGENLVVIVPDGGGEQIYRCQTPEDMFGLDLEDIQNTEGGSASADSETTLAEKPDYSDLTVEAEREAKLKTYFERLKTETNPDDANLIAEDIWAVWLDSGSDTVNFILRRGTAAQKRNDIKLARRMYDHVTTLNPEYAEGWARSSRLALEEKDLSRALTESAQTLVYEPRHFYALWTMGNVFEQLGRQDEALEAYREANKLYPELKAVKDRIGTLQSDIEGDVL